MYRFPSGERVSYGYGVEAVTKTGRAPKAGARRHGTGGPGRLREMTGQLRLERDRTRHLLDIAGTMLLALDREGKVTLINRKGCEILGWPEHEILGKDWFDNFLPAGVREKVRSSFLEYLAGGGPEHYENLVLAKGGGERLIAWHIVTLRDGDGKPTGTLSSGEDITGRRRAEEAVQRSEKRFRELLDNLSEVVVEADIEGNITYVSRQAEKLYEFSPEELVGKNIANLIHPDDLKAALEALTSVTTGDPFFDFEFRTAHKDGHFVPSSATGRMVREGDDLRIVGILKDITERRRSEDALKRSERLFRLLAENAQDMIFRVQIQPRLSVEYVSPSALPITGYAAEEYYADPILGFGLIPFEGHPVLEGASWAKDMEGKPQSMRWQRKDGGVVWLEVVNHPVLNASGQLVAVEGVARDITARKSAEDALRESEEKFRDLAEQSPNMIFINAKGRVVYANRMCEEVMGYPRAEFYSPGFNFMDLTAPEHRALVAEKYGSHLSGRDVSPYEYAVITRTGKRIDAILSTKLITYGGEPGLLGTITDITERKNAEKALRESEEKYRGLFESSPEGVVMLDLDGKVIDINEAGWNLIELPRSDVIGKHFLDLTGTSPENASKFLALFPRFLDGENVPPFELELRTRRGTRWQEVYPALLRKDGEPQAIQVIFRDITGRRQAEEKIRASLNEKEVLLKEIHHRVKNNLQIIHSLLNMQSRGIKDAGVLDSLRESQNRVRTMALIHERLYRSTDLSEIDFKQYVGRLVGELCTSFGMNADRIRLETQLSDVSMGIDSAIPCGFIINELVSNSLKHGFPDGRQGCLRITLDSEPDGTVRMGVGDTGVGLPEGLDFRKTESLGLQLVCTLVEQLHGSIDLDRTRGTEFLVVFNQAGPEEG